MQKIKEWLHEREKLMLGVKRKAPGR